jgi:hypothetical protein
MRPGRLLANNKKYESRKHESTKARKKDRSVFSYFDAFVISLLSYSFAFTVAVIGLVQNFASGS